jgi:chemotaxis protein CheX
MKKTGFTSIHFMSDQFSEELNKAALKVGTMAEFTAQERLGVHLVTFPAHIDGDEAGLEAQVKTWLVSPAAVHVFDLQAVEKFKPNAYRFFLFFAQQLKTHKKKLFCLHASPSLTSQFKQDGLMAVFTPIASLEEAQRRANPVKPALDVELVNPFIQGTKTVLETQANITLQIGKPYLRKRDEKIPMEIAGVIALQCSEFTGSIALCFSSRVFLNIYEALVGERIEAINQESQDAAGELLNMIFGAAKTELNDRKGYTLQKAIPTVLCGDQLRIHHQGSAPTIVLPFEGQIGAFHIEISIEHS